MMPKSRSILTTPWRLGDSLPGSTWFSPSSHLPSPLPIIYLLPWWHSESYLPKQGLNPCPLQWKGWALTTGPPGHSLPGAILTKLPTHSDPYHDSTCPLCPLIVPVFHLNKKPLSSRVLGSSGHTYLIILMCEWLLLVFSILQRGCLLCKKKSLTCLNLPLCYSILPYRFHQTHHLALLSHGPGFQKHTDPSHRYP